MRYTISSKEKILNEDIIVLSKEERIKLAIWVVKGIENVVKANPKRLEDLL